MVHTCAVVVRGERGSSRRRGRLWKRLRREKEKERCGVKSFGDGGRGGTHRWRKGERERGGRVRG